VHSATRKRRVQQNTIHSRRGGDRINYPGAVAHPTAEMLVAKMLFNSVISTINQRSKILTMDIPWSVFLDYLGTNSFE